jgi:hypothetical protein
VKKYVSLIGMFYHDLGVTLDGVWIGDSIYWLLVYPSELQVITVLSLISTLYKSLNSKSPRIYSDFNSSFLVTASNSGESLASRAQFFPSRFQYRTAAQLITSELDCRFSAELHSADLGSSLYSLGADPTENTASNSSSFVVGGCLAITRISLTCLLSSNPETGLI